MRYRFRTVAAVSVTAWIVACGGDVVSVGPNIVYRENSNNSSAVATSSGYGTSIVSGVSDSTSNGVTYTCATYSCGLTEAECNGGFVAFTTFPNGCPGPCECVDEDSSKPILTDSGPAVDATVDGAGQSADDGGGSDASPCANGVVEFELTATSQRTFCAVTQTPSPGATWLTILGYTDGGLPGFQPGGRVACDSCTLVDDPPYTVVYPVVPNPPVMYIWNGESQAIGTCGGDSAPQACTTPECAAPAQYVAHMCGWIVPGTDCTAFDGGNGQLECVDVPFLYPASGTVVGVLN